MSGHCPKPEVDNTYSLVIDPEWHPRDDDNHEARDVDSKDEEGQLAGKSELDSETAVSTCKL